MRSILLAFALLGVVPVAARAQPGGGGGPPPAMVVLDVAKLQTVEQWREVTGELQAVRRTILAAQQEGWVLEMLPREGDHVKAGDIVARLDGKLAELEVQRAEAVVKKWEAEIAQRQAGLEKAQRDLDRRRAASVKESASATEVADAQTEVASSVARLDQARAEQASATADLGLARKRMEDMTIRAPISGIVKAKKTEIGQWLSRGDAVVELVQLDSVEAWLDVPEALVRRIQKKRTDNTAAPPVRVQVRITALDEVREADVVGIVPAADPMSRLIPVRVLLENADELIKPGMSVTGLVPTGNAEPTLTIHKDGLMRNDAGAYVFFSAGGVAQIARVDVLFALSDRLAVRSDRLAPGVQIVVQGNERLSPGQPLMPAAPPPPSSAPAAGPKGSAPEAAPAGPGAKKEGEK
jgi:membrane fusion protein (multidrug efflux system)